MISAGQKNKRIVWAAVFLLSFASLLWIAADRTPVYPEPGIVASGGGPRIPQPGATLLQTMEYNHGRGLRMFHLAVQENERGELLCRPPVAAASFGPPSAAQELGPVLAWLARHPDATLLVEFPDGIGDGLARMKEVLPPQVQPQIVVQVNDPSHAESAAALGYVEIVWLVHDARIQQDAIREELGRGRVQAIALPVSLTRQGMIHRFRRHEMRLYVYFVESCDMLHSLRRTGADAVYSSTLVPGVCGVMPRGLLVSEAR